MNRQPPRRPLLHALLSALTRKAPEQTKQYKQPPRRPAERDPAAWRTYWEALSQPWRTEPEIDLKRQADLARHRAIVPDVEKGIYPYKGMQLSRADVEWLLATHQDGRGPIDWNEPSQHGRDGLDLRGADLRNENLQNLPLARLQGGLAVGNFRDATEEQRHKPRHDPSNKYVQYCLQ